MVGNAFLPGLKVVKSLSQLSIFIFAVQVYEIYGRKWKELKLFFGEKVCLTGINDVNDVQLRM